MAVPVRGDLSIEQVLIYLESFINYGLCAVKFTCDKDMTTRSCGSIIQPMAESSFAFVDTMR